MKRTIKLFCFIFNISILVGCTSLEIIPEPISCQSKDKKTVASYSYSFGNTWLTQDAYNELVKKTEYSMKNIKHIEHIPESTKLPHLNIKATDKKFKGCDGAYITFLTLGLWPSSCTTEGMYSFEFETFLEGELIRNEQYSVNQTETAHLLLIPFGYTQMALLADYKPLDEYTDALNRNKYVNCK